MSANDAKLIAYIRSLRKMIEKQKELADAVEEMDAAGRAYDPNSKPEDITAQHQKIRECEAALEVVTKNYCDARGLEAIPDGERFAGDAEVIN